MKKSILSIALIIIILSIVGIFYWGKNNKDSADGVNLRITSEKEFNLSYEIKLEQLNFNEVLVKGSTIPKGTNTYSLPLKDGEASIIMYYGDGNQEVLAGYIDSNTKSVHINMDIKEENNAIVIDISGKNGIEKVDERIIIEDEE